MKMAGRHERAGTPVRKLFDVQGDGRVYCRGEKKWWQDVFTGHGGMLRCLSLSSLRFLADLEIGIYMILYGG